MSNYYQKTETQMTPLVDYTTLSEQSLTTLREYMDYQSRETLMDIMNTQRAAKAGYAAVIGYAAVLQKAKQAMASFPGEEEDFREILTDIRHNISDLATGRRR